jgi:Protein of unknown function (DUF3034)
MLHIVMAQRFGLQINHQRMGCGRIRIDVDRVVGCLLSHRFAPGPQRVVTGVEILQSGNAAGIGAIGKGNRGPGLYDTDARYELTVDLIDGRLPVNRRQSFNLGATVPGQNIDQTVVGAKWRLFGDAVIDQDRWWPQMAAGVQWKHNDNFELVPRALGAKHAQGADFYVAATKVWLAGPFGRSWIADLTLRETEANQFGILGFGGDLGGYHLMTEGSLGAFLLDNLLLGAECRQKPDNLSAFRENSADDLFLVIFPWKYLSLTAAYVNLGNIANRPGQHALYISLQASW